MLRPEPLLVVGTLGQALVQRVTLPRSLEPLKARMQNHQPASKPEERTAKFIGLFFSALPNPMFATKMYECGPILWSLAVFSMSTGDPIGLI